jgi:LmbE family N-acetylglucosaminyl deacetylase
VVKRAYAIAAWAYATRWRVASGRRSLVSPQASLRPNVRADPGAPALLLSPHLDDAVFDCWSVLTSGHKQRIVNVFAGVPSPGFVTAWDRACGAAESAAHVRARIAEDSEVLGRIGHRADYLSFVDAQYRAGHPSAMALDRAISDVAPAASLVYAPAALGFAPPDHLLLRTYARLLARQGMPVMLYADLPYAVRAGRWPAWVRGGARQARDPDDAFWRPALWAVPEIVDVEVVPLPRDIASAKLAAMRAYRTQFPGLDHDGRLSDPSTHRYEVFWKLRCTAAGGLPGASASASVRPGTN